jgi:hypothetical protein
VSLRNFNVGIWIDEYRPLRERYRVRLCKQIRRWKVITCG